MAAGMAASAPAARPRFMAWVESVTIGAQLLPVRANTAHPSPTIKVTSAPAPAAASLRRVQAAVSLGGDGRAATRTVSRGTAGCFAVLSRRATTSSAAAPSVPIICASSVSAPRTSANGAASTVLCARRMGRERRLVSTELTGATRQIVPAIHARMRNKRVDDPNQLRPRPASASSKPTDQLAATRAAKPHAGMAPAAVDNAAGAESRPARYRSTTAERANASGPMNTANRSRTKPAPGSIIALLNNSPVAPMNAIKAVAAKPAAQRCVALSPSPWARRDHASGMDGRAMPRSLACCSRLSSTILPCSSRQDRGYQRNSRAYRRRR
ncbi:hypothetical protein ABIB26_004289 [Arthrobacter sp. UYEF20]